MNVIEKMSKSKKIHFYNCIKIEFYGRFATRIQAYIANNQVTFRTS